MANPRKARTRCTQRDQAQSGRGHGANLRLAFSIVAGVSALTACGGGKEPVGAVSDDQISTYLQNNASFAQRFGGTNGTACAVRTLGFDSTHVYVLAVCKGPYGAKGSEGVAISLNTSAQISGYAQPQEGDQYASSIKAIFPSKIADQLLSHDYDVEPLAKKLGIQL